MLLCWEWGLWKESGLITGLIVTQNRWHGEGEKKIRVSAKLPKERSAIYFLMYFLMLKKLKIPKPKETEKASWTYITIFIY